MADTRQKLKISEEISKDYRYLENVFCEGVTEECK